MQKRRPGRPRKEMREYDEALELIGGLRRVLERVYSAQPSAEATAEELARLANRPRVSGQTILNWIEFYGEQEVIA